MSFCLGIKVREGLIAIADTRLTTGHEYQVAKKLRTYGELGYPLFAMSSGLRSASDKVLTYFRHQLEERSTPYRRVHDALKDISEQIRKVRTEDAEALSESGLDYNVHLIFGGQLVDDPEPKMFLVYPQANWVEVGEDTPYQIIGNVGYGKPILHRALGYEDDLKFAFTVGCIAIDNTRLNTADVDYPMDVALLRNNAGHLVERRYTEDELREFSKTFQDRMREAVNGLPLHWMNGLFDQVDVDANVPES